MSAVAKAWSVVVLLGIAAFCAESWTDAHSVVPGKVRPMMSLGVAYAKAGRFQEARQTFRDIVLLFPDDASAQVLAKVEDAQTGSHLGEIETAQHAFEQLIIENQDNPIPELLPAYSDLAAIYNMENRPQDALGLLETLIAIYPDYRMNAWANFNRGAALRLLGKCTEAEAAFHMAHFIDNSAPLMACP